MQGEPKSGEAFDAAVAQLAKVHARAYSDAGLADSCVEAGYIEFLRGGEFQTFTSCAKAWQAVKAMNETVGTNFFKVMVDAAHCGDSDLDIPKNSSHSEILMGRTGYLRFRQDHSGMPKYR